MVWLTLGESSGMRDRISLLEGWGARWLEEDKVRQSFKKTKKKQEEYESYHKKITETLEQWADLYPSEADAARLGDESSPKTE